MLLFQYYIITILLNKVELIKCEHDFMYLIFGNLIHCTIVSYVFEVVYNIIQGINCLLLLRNNFMIKIL